MSMVALRAIRFLVGAVLAIGLVGPGVATAAGPAPRPGPATKPRALESWSTDGALPVRSGTCPCVHGSRRGSIVSVANACTIPLDVVGMWDDGADRPGAPPPFIPNGRRKFIHLRLQPAHRGIISIPVGGRTMFAVDDCSAPFQPGGFGFAQN